MAGSAAIAPPPIWPPPLSFVLLSCTACIVAVGQSQWLRKTSLNPPCGTIAATLPPPPRNMEQWPLQSQHFCSQKCYTPLSPSFTTVRQCLCFFPSCILVLEPRFLWNDCKHRDFGTIGWNFGGWNLEQWPLQSQHFCSQKCYTPPPPNLLGLEGYSAIASQGSWFWITPGGL